MEQYKIENCLPLLRTYGRTWLGREKEALYFNWTDSGLEFMFEGTFLGAYFLADGEDETEQMQTGETVTRKNFPVLGILLDDSEFLYRRTEIGYGEEFHTIFQSSQAEKHKIRLIKLTENGKTFLGIRSFSMEGMIAAPPVTERKRIEFIGDSITCGFGNGTLERDRGFYSSEENGFLAHGSVAGRLLGMETSMICISGITCARHASLPMDYAMEELYEYTDYPGQRRSENPPEPERWNFDQHPNDYVVINLGTNDATAVMQSEDPVREERGFCAEYRRFVELVRRCSGKDTKIICALGCMDYFLYHDLIRVTEAYRRDTGDRNLFTYQYQKLNGMADGFGACAHPSEKTQKKMGKEIADFIRKLENTDFTI